MNEVSKPRLAIKPEDTFTSVASLTKVKNVSDKNTASVAVGKSKSAKKRRRKKAFPWQSIQMKEAVASNVLDAK